ncbi:MAG: hypothetical protein RLZZ111_331 [Planctomycetota bacterium]|jgi:hypothetical protein
MIERNRLMPSSSDFRVCLAPSLLPPCAAAWAALTVIAVCAPGAFGQQEEDARFSNWTRIETAAETRAYKEALKGGTFDATARGYLEQIALPQLALEANRPNIERIRKRMREYLLADIGDAKAAEEATKTFLTVMQALAANGEAEPVVRVNALLLVGELQGADRKPWPPAAPVLANAAVNADLPKAVRVAAVVGLARHVEAARGQVEAQQRLGPIVMPVIRAILTAAKGADQPAETEWLAARCLSMLPALGPLPPDAATEVVRILGDDTCAMNLRVRAASALGLSAGADSKIDVAAAIRSIEDVGIGGLERDVAKADRILLERLYGGASDQVPGGMPPGMPPPGFGPGFPGGPPPGFSPSPEGFTDPSLQPPGEQLIPREVCRRAAWRLSTLADAILTEDRKRGLSSLLPEADRPPAEKLAQRLRRAAIELDATPEDPVLRQVLRELKPAPAAAAPAAEEAGEGQPPAAAR